MIEFNLDTAPKKPPCVNMRVSFFFFVLFLCGMEHAKESIIMILHIVAVVVIIHLFIHVHRMQYLYVECNICARWV